MAVAREAALPPATAASMSQSLPDTLELLGGPPEPLPGGPERQPLPLGDMTVASALELLGITSSSEGMAAASLSSLSSIRSRGSSTHSTVPAIRSRLGAPLALKLRAAGRILQARRLQTGREAGAVRQRFREVRRPAAREPRGGRCTREQTIRAQVRRELEHQRYLLDLGRRDERRPPLVDSNRAAARDKRFVHTRPSGSHSVHGSAAGPQRLQPPHAPVGRMEGSQFKLSLLEGLRDKLLRKLAFVGWRREVRLRSEGVRLAAMIQDRERADTLRVRRALVAAEGKADRPDPSRQRSAGRLCCLPGRLA